MKTLKRIGFVIAMLVIGIGFPAMLFTSMTFANIFALFLAVFGGGFCIYAMWLAAKNIFPVFLLALLLLTLSAPAWAGEDPEQVIEMNDKNMPERKKQWVRETQTRNNKLEEKIKRAMNLRAKCPLCKAESKAIGALVVATFAPGYLQSYSHRDNQAYFTMSGWHGHSDGKTLVFVCPKCGIVFTKPNPVKEE